MPELRGRQAPVPLDDFRIHAAGEPGPNRSGEFVLYWMQMTQRAHDNFALNFAIERANERGLPVLAVFRLRDDYPWASDRFHAFILQGLDGMEEAMAERGVEWALLHEAAPDERSALAALVGRAALVVTDYFPTFIAPRQLRELRTRTATPIIAVDSATVVPVGYHDREHATARGFRPLVEEALPHYLRPVDNAATARVRRRVGVEGIRVPAAEIPAFVAGCRVDHGVGIVETRGGTAAGRERLAHFLRHGLHRYVEDRGDPTVDATSRLSPYLHFGQLSPQEILLAAREAGPGDQYLKFQDELLTWRELAFNFVHWNRRHRTVEAIPPWARRELAEHERDERASLYGERELARAATGDELWNACQRAYLRDGFMHNYLRMLWGKAVIGWTPGAAVALRVLEELNNRYALDGRDPCSYGGILWVFGKFDRPFYRRAVYGTVRYMSLRAAAGKFDVAAYLARYPASVPASPSPAMT